MKIIFGFFLFMSIAASAMEEKQDPYMSDEFMAMCTSLLEWQRGHRLINEKSFEEEGFKVIKRDFNKLPFMQKKALQKMYPTLPLVDYDV